MWVEFGDGSTMLLSGLEIRKSGMSASELALSRRATDQGKPKIENQQTFHKASLR